jgi:uncharacterized protein involved in exopolysaccharide biosynthesis
MKTNPDNRMLAVSQKIYNGLLLAYPPAHRAEYGAAMAQLFRDQCDDAWAESGGWGLLKLWLRVVPDLIRTSIVERFAAFTERKSMPEKIASLVQPRTIFLRIFMMVFLTSVIISVIITNILPETYASTAKIKVENDHFATEYDPYFMQTQFEIMESELVLDQVIDRLNLNVAWGKKYFAGETLKTSETRQILRGRLNLAPVRNTKLVAITAYSDDKVEAAQVANAISVAYQDYRVDIEREAASKNFDLLRRQYAIEEDQIKQAQAARTTGSAADNEAELARKIEAHKLLNLKMTASEIDLKIPSTSMVQITDTAEPGIRPVRPNKAADVVMGTVWGIVLASVIGGLSVLIVLGLRKRKVLKMTAG